MKVCPLSRTASIEYFRKDETEMSAREEGGECRTESPSYPTLRHQSDFMEAKDLDVDQRTAWVSAVKLQLCGAELRRIFDQFSGRWDYSVSIKTVQRLRCVRTVGGREMQFR